MQFQRFGVVILAAAMASSAQAQTAAPQVTPEQIAAQVRQLCAYKPAQDSFNVNYMRKKMAVSDRMETRRVETEMAGHATMVDRCLTDVSKRIDEQAKTNQPQTIAAYRAAVAQLRQSSMGDIRAAYASYGFRPSSAAPGPRFGYCRIHDNFDPPTYKDYMNNYYVSGVVTDRDPEAEVADRDEYTPKTQAGARTLAAMAKWIAVKYKPATSRDGQFCTFFTSANEAQQAIDKEVADDAIETGVQ